jgi:hypothetical protein
LLTRLYLWPWVHALPKREALAILVLPHAFRSIGLSFLETGVVSPSLPSAFAIPAAYGDLGAALLAIAAVLALSVRARSAIALVWLFNIWGSIDLVFGFYRALANNLEPSTLGAAYYLPTFLVPALLILHGLVFTVLVGSRAGKLAVSLSAMSDSG